MRVLAVHNYYRSEMPSGENVAFDAETDLLRSYGHTVETYTRSSDELVPRGWLGTLQGGASVPWNFRAFSRLRAEVRRFRPDVVHLHNTFPLISPAAIWAVGDDAALVATLHNYRAVCGRGVPKIVDGQLCTACLDARSTVALIKGRCYRDSVPASIPLAINIELHRLIKTWNRLHRIICLNTFQVDLLERAGLNRSRMVIKPNFVSAPEAPMSWHMREREFVFAGRVSREKGVHVLIDAWRKWGAAAPRLWVVGDGPERKELEAASADSNVRFVGSVSRAETMGYIGRCHGLLLPSMWTEGFPMVVAEAFGLGTPIICSDIKPLHEIISEGVNGAFFSVGDPDSALASLIELSEDGGRKLAALARGARASYESFYSPESNHAQILAIYRAAMDTRKVPI